MNRLDDILRNVLRYLKARKQIADTLDKINGFVDEEKTARFEIPGIP